MTAAGGGPAVMTADPPAVIPLAPPPRSVRAALRHPRLMPYNRLIVAVVVANAVAAGALLRWAEHDRAAAGVTLLATLAQVNLLVAVTPRQHVVINAVGWLATRPGTRWPLRARWTLGKYYHLGGIHVGAALAGAAWYFVYVAGLATGVALGTPGLSPWSLAIAAVVVAVLAAMVVLALPHHRRAHHDRFEVTHRLGAWTVLGLVWVNAVVASRARGVPLASSVNVWLLVVTTALALWPWLLLRRVPITVERPSGHAAIVSLDHGVTPPIGTTRAISRRVLVGWHHFANVPAAAGRPGYRMLVSRAGDWTGAFIDDPPSHVWVRGLPAVGVANVRQLFTKVVYVVTGSGIGPALGHLLAGGRPAKLVWVTREPTATYGDALVGEVLTAQPDALIWNTDVHGKPDVLRLAHHVYLETGAEAVICIANRAVTWDVVHGLERRGIPAFGPIWDS